MVFLFLKLQPISDLCDSQKDHDKKEEGCTTHHISLITAINISFLETWQF